MRLAIMQPYFFPYTGHFSLIAACDEWVVFDVSQYTPRGWMNRNRMLHPTTGWQWMTVPLANSSIHISTHEACVLDPAMAWARVRGQLSVYRRAPYYRAVLDLVEAVFADADLSLVRLNVRGLAAVCAYIGLPFHYRICSELELNLPRGLGAGGWAPAISGRLGASSYVNPAGGRGLFELASFKRRGVHLHYLQARPFTYSPTGFLFEPDLSVLDALMWNPPEDVLAGVQAYSLETVQEYALA